MLSHFLIALLSYAAAYWIVGTENRIWRAVLGLPAALLLGWLGGALIASFTLAPLFGFEPKDSLFALVGRGFLWALFGASYGTYRAWRKLGSGLTWSSKNLPESTEKSRPSTAHAIATTVNATAIEQSGIEDQINQVAAKVDEGVIDERAGKAEHEHISQEGRQPNAGLEASRVQSQAHAESERVNTAIGAHAERSSENADEGRAEPSEVTKVTPPPQPQKRTNKFGFVLVFGFTALVLFLAVTGKPSQDHPHTQAAGQPAQNSAQQDLKDDEARKIHFDEIYRSHPDAAQIVESDAFKAWLDKPGNDVWIETTKTGTATQVIAMFDSFKADHKTQPQPQPQLLADEPTNQEPSRSANSPSPRPPATRVSLQDFQRRTDVSSALKRSYAEYPYLQTEDGREAVRLIMLRAIDLVQNNGYHPVDAVENAVNLIAHRHEPAWYRAATPNAGVQSDSAQPEKPARPCRQVSASPLNFVCE